MARLLKIGEVGNMTSEHMKKIREETIKKWNDLGFLDGLKGHVTNNIAQLYESEASHLINEYTVSGMSTPHQVKKHKL